jgi:hypothetical protein
MCNLVVHNAAPYLRELANLRCAFQAVTFTGPD